MRIAMMTNNYKPFVGGVPISIERLADSLRDLGHSVYVFAPDYKSPVDDDEYTFRFPTMKHKIAGAIPIPNLIYGYVKNAISTLDIDLIHILCAYWGFVCMSLHLGFHWSMMLAMARKHLQPSSMRIWSLRLIGWLWAVYGAFAFRRRGVSLYLLLRSHFVFYDYSEPVILFLINYLSVMVMFVLIGYLISMLLKRLPTFYLH